MRYQNLTAAFAVILPVALGLGLVYLTIVGRIEAGAAVIATLGIAGVIGIAVYVRDDAASPDDERAQRTPVAPFRRTCAGRRSRRDWLP